MPSLEYRKALIVGGTSGIGKGTATLLAEQGASVILIGRSKSKGPAVQREIREAAGRDRVELVPMDLSALKETRNIGAALTDHLGGLDWVLQTPGGINRENVRTAEGNSHMLAAGYLHRPIINQIVQPCLQRSSDPRIVVTTAAVPDTILPDWDNLEGPQNYSGFKQLPHLQAANQLMVQDLATEPNGITVSALAILMADTDAFRNAPLLFRVLLPILRRTIMISPELVAETIAWMLTSPEGKEQRRIVDVTDLLGWYTGVSLTWAAYDGPSNAVGLIPQENKPPSPLTADTNKQHTIYKEQRR